MSLFKSFKKALGFPEDYNNDLGDISDLEDKDEDIQTDNKKSPEATTNAAPAPQSELVSDDFLLNLATEIINSVAPNSDDHKILVSAVSTTLSKQIPLITERGRQEAENKYLRERNLLQREIYDLKKQISSEPASEPDSDNEEQIALLKSEIDGLQQHIVNLEAEREQFLLENRYMAERIRGSMPENIINIPENNIDNSKLAEENEKLKNENSKLKQQLEKCLSVEEQDFFKKSIEQQIEKFETVLGKKDAEIKSLRNEKNNLNDECQKYAARITIDDEKIDSLEKKVAELHKTIQTNLIDHATEQDKLNKEIKRLSAMISEPIKELKTQRKAKPKQQEKASQVNQEISPTAEALAIDELMDSTEWFIAPQPGPRIKDPEVTENFGYKETVRKKAHKHDDNQLTLF